MNALAQVIEEPIAADTAPLTPMVMLDRAVASGASIEVMSKLMDLQERWEKNQARKDFDAAIAAAKAEFGPVVRNKTGHNQKRYADFSAYAKEVDPVLARHGLSYRFRSDQEGTIKVTCVVSHKNGHSEENSLAGPADASGSKNAIQAIGSTLTYLQRYTLTQALGLAASDDDDARGADAAPISGAAEAAINALRQRTTGEALKAWREENKAQLGKLDRNDFAAVNRAFRAHGESLEAAQ